MSSPEAPRPPGTVVRWECVLCRHEVIAPSDAWPNPVHVCAVEARLRELIREELAAVGARRPSPENP